MRLSLKNLANNVDIWDSDFDWGTKDCSQFELLFENSQQLFPKIGPSETQKHQILSPQHQEYEENISNFLNNSPYSSSNEQPLSSKSSTKTIFPSQDRLELGKRPAKQDKSGLYSKTYRQRKKQMVKSMQEENIYLKKKINELQNRLREKQLELNRIKCGFIQDDLSIQQLNEEVMKKLRIIADEEPNQMKEQQSEKLRDQQRKLKEFQKLFENEGMGGKKTIEMLEYYTNEFLENVLRDRQKFFVLQCLKPPQKLQQKTPLQIAFLQAFQPTQEQFQRHISFQNSMRPIMTELKNTCQQFYKSSRKVIKVLENINQMAKTEFSDNVELLKKRFNTVIWFQANQHRKEMRQLRAQWIQLIKDEKYEDEEISAKQIKKKSHK